MKVLDFKYDELYHIQVKTKDIVGSWKRFRVRAHTLRPEEYCIYEGRTGGQLSIYNCDTNSLEVVPENEWKHSRPVFFETCEYAFAISIKGIKEGTEPKVIHPDSSVEELFNSIDTGDSYILSGNVDFLNQPGRFSLNFVFTTVDGIEHNEFFDFDVVSPKLDTKGDLNTIVKELKLEYDDLVFRYLTLTCQQFDFGNEANNDLIWLSVFKKIVGSYIIAVRYILYAPHNKDFTSIEFRRPDRIKRWTNQLTEEFCNDEARDKELAYRKHYRTEQIESTNNTLENRFVKYTIERMSERLERVMDKVRGKDTSSNEVDYLSDKLKELRVLRNNSFFRPIGRFEGFKQESMVLQQRNGYSQVYRYWLILQNGLNLIDGNTSVGVQPVWKLYELWCFLKVKRLVTSILGLDTHSLDDLMFIHEDTHKMFDPFNGGDLTGHVSYDNPLNGDIIELGYQYSFSRSASSGDMFSMTAEQKPDIVMHIQKKNGFVLTYLFDAKYRVYGDDDTSVTSAIDSPPDDTLNQMHRYRDAIYYNDKKGKSMSKEVVGGYILFPGRLDEANKQRLIDDSRYEDLPYYLKSIEYVNIGAFPLLPNENSGILLEHFLRRIILEETIANQIDDTIPQRGLYYSLENDGISVIIGCYKSDAHHQWIIRNGKYNLRLDKDREGAIGLNNGFTNAQYLVLYEVGKKQSVETYRLTGSSDVMTREDLLLSGYPDPKGKVYLVIDIDNEIDARLKNHVWDLSSELFCTDNGKPTLMKYVNLFPPESFGVE